MPPVLRRRETHRTIFPPVSTIIGTALFARLFLHAAARCDIYRMGNKPKARPPYFVVFGNQLDGLAESYKRFLINGLRDTFQLYGVPIRITLP